MMPRTLPEQLHWPDGSSGANGLDPATLNATLALFDAIALDHEVLVGYALANGARLDACLEIQNKAPVSVLTRAVHCATWAPVEESAGVPARYKERSPFDEYRSQVVTLLVKAGAKDRHALMAFSGCDWLLNSSSGKPQHDPMVVAVEQAGLDALLLEPAEGDAFRFFDEDRKPLTARGRFFGRSHESWLAVAARHRRPDVIQHWFASGGTLNASPITSFISPLVAVLEPAPPGVDISPDHESAAQALLIDAWMRAPSALYRQEVLHLVVARTQWGHLLKEQRGASPDDPKVVRRIDQVLQAALEARPIDLRLTREESEAIKCRTRLPLVEKALAGMEDVVLRHALRSETAEKPRPRARL